MSALSLYIERLTELQKKIGYNDSTRKNKSQTKSQATSKFFGSNMFIDSDETSFLIQIVNRLFIILESRFTHTHTYSYMNRNESVEICLNDIFWLRTMPMLFEMCSTTNIRLKRPNSYSKLLEITIFLKQYLIFHSECHENSGKIASIQNSNDFRLKSMQ